MSCCDQFAIPLTPELPPGALFFFLKRATVLAAGAHDGAFERAPPGRRRFGSAYR